MIRSIGKVAVLCLFLQTNLLMGQGLPADTSGVQISFGYWNDNWLYQDQFKRLIEPGDDDHLTASFRMALSSSMNDLWRDLEIYYAIFTDRQEALRFDLLAARYAREYRLPRWRYKLGAGALIRGQLGGAAIQNAYHELRGYQRLELSYPDDMRFGLLFYGRAVRTLIKISDLHLDAYGTTALRIGSGPTNLRGGLEATTAHDLFSHTLRLQVTVRIGYAHYLVPREVIKPHFAYGPVAGLHMAASFHKRIGIALWMTENQYGLQDPHYGVTLLYRPRNLVLPGLSTVIFP